MKRKIVLAKLEIAHAQINISKSSQVKTRQSLKSLGEAISLLQKPFCEFKAATEKVRLSMIELKLKRIAQAGQRGKLAGRNLRTRINAKGGELGA
jgi:hypothetical protein